MHFIDFVYVTGVASSGERHGHRNIGIEHEATQATEKPPGQTFVDFVNSCSMLAVCRRLDGVFSKESCFISIPSDSLFAARAGCSQAYNSAVSDCEPVIGRRS